MTDTRERRSMTARHKLAILAGLTLAGWAIIAGICWLVQQSSHLAWTELMFLAAGAAIFALWVMALTSPADAGR